MSLTLLTRSWRRLGESALSTAPLDVDARSFPTTRTPSCWSRSSLPCRTVNHRMLPPPACTRVPLVMRVSPFLRLDVTCWGGWGRTLRCPTLHVLPAARLNSPWLWTCCRTSWTSWRPRSVRRVLYLGPRKREKRSTVQLAYM